MTRSRHEWLGLIEVSGLFLAAPVLDDVFPQGLDALEHGKPQRLRSAYEEWRDAVDVDDPALDALHAAWIDEVLVTALDLTPDVLRKTSEIPVSLNVTLPEHGVTFGPDVMVAEPGSEAALLAIHVFAPDIDLDATRGFDGWATTPKDRMVALLRAIGCPFGLVTNGERWLLVHAPTDGVTGFASWYARLWPQEPDTLRAFASLLGIRRFLGDPQTKLPKLYERSLSHQDRVTDALGDQVRQAVEVLVQALDRADQDRNRELLRDVDPRTLYEAGLSVMMRLVFLLAAEERGLLLLGEERYDRFYALSTLRMQLRADSEEILERRRSAWSRLLALFRAVYGGIEHPTLRLPALGGSLFDPDRYVFLEGRAKGTHWKSDPAEPLPIDDRTVLLLLESIQTFEGRTLSYRALDVEQIGHVYEGLLERTVVRIDDVTLELEAKSDARDPRVKLGELDSARLDGVTKVVALIKDRSGRSESAIRNGIGRAVSDGVAARLLTVCQGDSSVRDRILPYASLLRSDPWGYPLVRHPGSFVVAIGSDRQDSGTHYTPTHLTEKIVRDSLTPLVFKGAVERTARSEWRLISPSEILSLKICDPAMGSGAFLVQACRWLGERLVEAWTISEKNGRRISIEGEAIEENVRDLELLPSDVDERLTLARRLIAERCLYGVDLNPMAIELTKLSLWLTTMSRGKPFGFLDHNLRAGNSLIGISSIDQLTELDLAPDTNAQQRLFGRKIIDANSNSLEIRLKIREVRVIDTEDIKALGALNAEARRMVVRLDAIADLLIGIYLSEPDARRRSIRLGILATHADKILDTIPPDDHTTHETEEHDLLGVKAANVKPFHWPLEFPEVFLNGGNGFDAMIGNPPWGSISNLEESSYLRSIFTNSNYKLINKFKFFIERMVELTAAPDGMIGVLVPSSLMENIGCRDTRKLVLSRRPMSFIDCGDGMFAGVTQSCCFMVLNNRPTPDYWSVEIGNLAENFKNVSHEDDLTTLESIKSRQNMVISASHAVALKPAGFILVSELADVFDSGIDYSRAALGADVFYNSPVPKDQGDEKVLRGRNIDQYHLTFEGIWLRSNWRLIQADHIRTDKKSRLKVNEKAYRVSPKILIRQTGDRIIAVVDEQRFYHQKSLLSMCPKDMESAYLLCALLNHPRTTEYYRSLTSQSGKVFAQVKKNFVEQIAVPWPSDGVLRGEVVALTKRIHAVDSREDREALVGRLERMLEPFF